MLRYPPRIVISLLLLGCILFAGPPCLGKGQGHRITTIYVLKGHAGTVLFDTEAAPGQVLIQDKESVFFVLSMSPDKEWVELSKMPADPEEAHGTNEEKLLMFVPQKRQVSHPTYGRRATLIGIEGRKVIWDMDNKIITTPLSELKALCLGAGTTPTHGKRPRSK